MPTAILPSTLTRFTGGTAAIPLGGATAGEVLDRLQQQYPDLRGWVLDEQGRLRQHVNVFVNEERAELATPVAEGDQVYVLQAISGGAPDGVATAEALVGTRKGLFVLRGRRGGPMEIAGRAFPGQEVDYAVFDPRGDTYLASVTHGHYGPHLYLAADPLGDWEQAEGPAFPEDTEASVQRIWAVVPGEAEGEVWAGVAPAALFHSRDGGRTWSLVRALWDDPTRPQWEGGLGGLALHSICPWPGEPAKLAVGISAAGVWITEDGGGSWRRGGRGLVPRYLPEEAREGSLTLCVHNMHRCPPRPERLYMQFHGGVYRSDDGGRSWESIAAGLPADFGFPLVADPADPDRAFVIPLVSDEDRVTPEGRLRVYETRDGGASWRSRSEGLPQESAYVNVLRQAFGHDGGDPLGLYFGTASGEVYGSADGGGSWRRVAEHLPRVLSVRCGRGGR